MSRVINGGNINPIPDTTVFNPAIDISQNYIHSLHVKNSNKIVGPTISPTYKYKEATILEDMLEYVNKTYGEHYKKENIECLDAWIARGTAATTCVDTAEKYLWRYGSKEGKNKKDLMKAMHYIMLTLYIDHYRKEGE